jgi:hypothetical protein
MPVKNSSIAFADLRDLLLELGFSETREKTRVIYRHPVGGTFLIRPYKDKDKVKLTDMLVVREQLDYNGIIAPDDLDRRLQKMPA